MDAKGGDPVLKYCAVGRQLGYAMYLSFDMITYVGDSVFRDMSMNGDCQLTLGAWVA